MVNVGKIRQLASKRGIKMKYLCEQLGVNPGYFANVDQGRFQMPPEKIYAVAELLGTTFNYLTDQTDFPISVAHMERSFMYDRYEKLKIERSLTSNYVERTIGIPYGSMEYVQKNALKLSEEQVNKLAILLNTTYDYLMGLTDDPAIPDDDRTGVKIGVFGDVAAGIPIKQIDNFDPEDPDSWEEIDRWTAKSGLYFALKIKGDSMSPRILDGDVVIVRKTPMVESGQLAVVAINGDTATCKKVLWDENGGVFLISLNPAYPPRYFSAEEVRTKPVTILGKVEELRGKV